MCVSHVLLFFARKALFLRVEHYVKGMLLIAA